MVVLLTCVEAIKAFVQANQSEASVRELGREHVTKLCNRIPAVTDLEALHQIQATLKELSLQAEESTKLWDRAATAKPEDKDLLMTWFNRSTAEYDWRSAQKV